MKSNASVSLLIEKLLIDVNSAIRSAEYQSHKLVLVILYDANRKSLKGELKNKGIELLNLSSLLSQKLISLSINERKKLLEDEVRNIANNCGESVWLSKLDLLCEPSLNSDPMLLLKWLAKSQLIVAIWPGVVEGTSLVYAKPGRPDYKTYPLNEFKNIQVIDACNGVK